MATVWQDIHDNYKSQDWINRPSIFAEQIVEYLPKKGKILELGAGQAQDGYYFAKLGFSVISSDIEDMALELAREKVESDETADIDIQKIDLRKELPFDDEGFDVVYAHLSLHYFDHQTTVELISQVERVLKPGGVFAFLVNSTNDPEYRQGKEIEPYYFEIGRATKRYFSKDTVRDYTKQFTADLLDEQGETYKDAVKGVHNLVRYVGRKPFS